MKLFSQEDCKKNGEFVKTKKKEYICKAYIPSLGTTVYNKLEDVYLKTSELESVVIIGPLNEEYTISLETFINSYKLINNEKITIDFLNNNNYLYSGNIISVKSDISNCKEVWCCQVDNDCKFDIVTAWNNVLKINDENKQIGDYILCSDKDNSPNFEDMWVVNGNAFKITYNLI